MTRNVAWDEARAQKYVIPIAVVTKWIRPSVIANLMSSPHQQHTLPLPTRIFAIRVQKYVESTASTQGDVCVETLELQDALLGFLQFLLPHQEGRTLA